MVEFHELFKGRDDAFGRYVPKPKKGAKEKGQAWTEKSSLTIHHYQQHLQGEESLGIIPIMTNDRCWWGAIDIDDYNLDLNDLQHRVEDSPFILCRSKSGGGHLFIFFQKPVEAGLLKDKLQEFSISLGYPNAEVFPKQEHSGEVGSWINLPYFDQEKTTRYALRNGDGLELNEFMTLAESKRISRKDLVRLQSALPKAFSDGPPCLQYLSTIKIGEGHKDLGLYNLAVYCKIKHGEDGWEKELEEMNQLYISPPAKESTVEKVKKPHRRKDYFYKCKEPPIVNYCNRELCRKRQFGIGGDDGNGVELIMGRLIKIDTNPPVWYLDIEGVNVEFGTEDLLYQNRFRKTCFETIHKIPNKMKDLMWDKFLQEKLDTLELVKAPEDAGMEGQFLHLLKVFCTERALAMTEQELLQGKPYHNNDEQRIYFRSKALIDFLKTQGLVVPTQKMYDYIRKLGGKSKVKKLKGKAERFWWIPEYQDQQNENFDLPDIEQEPF